MFERYDDASGNAGGVPIEPSHRRRFKSDARKFVAPLMRQGLGAERRPRVRLIEEHGRRAAEDLRCPQSLASASQTRFT